MSEIYEVADAVKDALNAASFNIGAVAFEAERVYVALEELTALDSLTVLVVPISDEVTQAARDLVTEDIAIRVGVIQHLPATAGDVTTPAANTAIDPLVQLCRQIALLYAPGTSAGDALWRRTVDKPIFDYARLSKDRVFFGQITFTFKQAG